VRLQKPSPASGGGEVRRVSGGGVGAFSGKSVTARRSTQPFRRLDRRQAVAVLGLVPALELRLPLLGEGGARLDQIALGAVLVQGRREMLLLGGRHRPHSAASYARC